MVVLEQSFSSCGEALAAVTRLERTEASVRKQAVAIELNYREEEVEEEVEEEGTPYWAACNVSR